MITLRWCIVGFLSALFALVIVGNAAILIKNAKDGKSRSLVYLVGIIACMNIYMLIPLKLNPAWLLVVFADPATVATIRALPFLLRQLTK